MQLIDQLEEKLRLGRQIPFTTQRVVDANEFSEMLERLRITVPSSVMESERMLKERDRILNEAESEAQQILQQAKQRARELLSENSIIALARDEAERIMQQSEVTARRRADEADIYATRVLEELGAKLQMITKQVDNGLQVMQGRKAAPAREPEGA